MGWCICSAHTLPNVFDAVHQIPAYIIDDRYSRATGPGRGFRRGHPLSGGTARYYSPAISAWRRSLKDCRVATPQATQSTLRHAHSGALWRRSSQQTLWQSRRLQQLHQWQGSGNCTWRRQQSAALSAAHPPAATRPTGGVLVYEQGDLAAWDQELHSACSAWPDRDVCNASILSGFPLISSCPSTSQACAAVDGLVRGACRSKSCCCCMPAGHYPPAAVARGQRGSRQPAGTQLGTDQQGEGLLHTHCTWTACHGVQVMSYRPQPLFSRYFVCRVLSRPAAEAWARWHTPSFVPSCCAGGTSPAPAGVRTRRQPAQPDSLPAHRGRRWGDIQRQAAGAA